MKNYINCLYFEINDFKQENLFTEPPAKNAKTPQIQCPYLDTINRHVLDFDFEKLCSVSLTRINVYACLVCGKYFQVTKVLIISGVPISF